MSGAICTNAELLALADQWRRLFIHAERNVPGEGADSPVHSAGAEAYSDECRLLFSLEAQILSARPETLAGAAAICTVALARHDILADIDLDGEPAFPSVLRRIAEVGLCAAGAAS